MSGFALSMVIATTVAIITALLIILYILDGEGRL